jgi:crossover junction endodeoxyribonuclease RuvC
VDATDALALAICHIWRGSATARIQTAVAAAAPSRIPRRVPGSKAAPRVPPVAPSGSATTGRSGLGVRAGGVR